MNTELKLRIENRYGKSVVSECFFTSPLKVGMPGGKRERLKVILMMASAGILKGDSFHYHIGCEADTKCLMTEQSYSKIFDTGDGMADRKVEIHLEKNASMYYKPCAVIPFGGSRFKSLMTVELFKESEFAWSDIFAAGRIGMGEKFAFRQYRSRVCVFEEGRPVWLDNFFLSPEDMPVDEMVFFDGYTHQGTFYYHGPEAREEQLLSAAKKKLGTEGLRIGVSRAVRGVCVRVLSGTAQDIEEVFEQFSILLDME